MSPSQRSANSRIQKSRPTGLLKATSMPGGEISSEPPLKKRKYVPGGPGGGGRYIEIDVTEAPAKTTSFRSRNQTASRVRPAQEGKTSNTNSTALPSLPPPLPESPVAPVTPSTASRPPKRQKANNRRYVSSAAAVLAAAQGDGYKPREERGWEEFHPDLDIDAKLAVFSSHEIDGIAPDTSINAADEKGAAADAEETEDIKRRPGRPRGSSMLNGISTPEVPKIVPPPGPNPQEKLTLPKPSFEFKDPFVRFEQKGVGLDNYVDRAMLSVGYQESDVFHRHERQLIRMPEPMDEDLELDAPAGPSGEPNAGAGVGRVEYDMDEQDAKWLEAYNARRKNEQFEPIKPAIFEITMTKIEKEWHALEKRIPKPNPKPPQTQRPRSSSDAAVNGEHIEGSEEQDSKCAVCDDGDCENSNAIVFCDGCDLAVHQECYGVPYIPEGQWLCRKCQLIGRGQPSCIFCPNTEGAFKQTNTSKWAHVVCAVWIPEVSIGNPSLMEPISDVENVPKSRWKLTCYICRQKMGACIQCSNKNCFVAFHVTCGRRAHLYLKMKLIPGAPAIMDSNGLKAYCDKHVPPEWQEEYNTEAATAEAMEYYKNTMQGKVWGDSQAAALALVPESQQLPNAPMDNNQTITPRLTLTLGGNKRKKAAAPKTIWKLPSGAPIIPQVILDRVVASLGRFTVRQRKQYAEDACKYWTLKREARRGAALLKRLQLQLETFSSMEMTRRNFAGMGVAGNVRLRRRIEFADRLYLDVDRVRMLCDEVKKREREKLKDVEMLRHIVDVVYFPVPPLLWPIFQKACNLDGKGVFRVGFQKIRSKLEDRVYTSVSEFSRDIANVFTSEIGVEAVGDTAELQMQISGRAPELSLEQREKRKLAKRIVKAIQPALEDALIKESELNGKPFEKELKDLDGILESSVLSRRGSPADGDLADGVGQHHLVELVDRTAPNYVEKEQPKDSHGSNAVKGSATTPPDAETAVASDIKSIPPGQETIEIDTQRPPVPESEDNQPLNTQTQPLNTPTYTAASLELVANETNGTKAEGEGSQIQPALSSTQVPPLTPPASFAGSQPLPPLAQGGIQWYMQPFDPIGTTIHEERWMGREVLRGMSEELSEMDEDEMQDLGDLVGDGFAGGVPAETNKAGEATVAATSKEAPTTRARTRRRWKGFK